MNVSERCTCGANISFEDMRGKEDSDDAQIILADFRAGHRCPTDGTSSHASAAKVASPIPF